MRASRAVLSTRVFSREISGIRIETSDDKNAKGKNTIGMTMPRMSPNCASDSARSFPNSARQ